MGNASLRVSLLGGFELRLDGAPLAPLDSSRAESLLAYLLLHRDAAQPRARLAYLLWPDSSEGQARTNLRHLLHTIRRQLSVLDDYLESTARALRWRPDAPIWLDVDEFMRSLSDVASPNTAVDRLTAAVALYGGDLLEGRYDEWLLPERERLRSHFLDALARLSAMLEARGELSGAVRRAEALLRQDPLREETYRALIRIHEASGDRARALHVYHMCASTLERELGVEPSTSTRELYERLVVESESRQAEPPRLGGPPFVGRSAERTKLARLWHESEQGLAQFVLVSGEPGIGKSRLVEEFRSWCVHRGAGVAAARAYAAEGALSYGPVVECLRSAELQRRIRRLSPEDVSELSRLLPELHSPASSPAPPDSLSQSDQRLRLFDAIARAVRATGTPQSCSCPSTTSNGATARRSNSYTS